MQIEISRNQNVGINICNIKIELVKFLIDYWSQDESSRELLSNREMYETYEAKAFCTRTIGMQVQKVVVSELQSEQEEANTKILSVALER